MKRPLERRLAAVFGLLLLGANFVATADAPEPVTLVAGRASIPLAGHVAVLRDEEGKWTLDDVRSPALAAQFSISDSASFNYGLSPDVYWYRFALRNPAGANSHDSEWVLEQMFPVIDYLDFYIARMDGRTESLLTGDMRQQPPAQFSYRRFAIPLRLAPGEEVMVHVRAYTTGRHQIHLRVWSPAGFLTEVTNENRRGGWFQGVFAVMFVYNLLIYFVIRDRAYLYYVLFLGSMVILSVMLSGDARQYGNGLFAGAPTLINAVTAVMLILLTIAALLFGREFLQMRQHLPRLHRLTTVLMVVGVVLVALYPVLGNRLISKLAILFFGPSFLGLLLVSVYLAHKGVRSAGFYLLAWSVLLLTMTFVLVQSFGGPAPTLLTIYAAPLAVCIAVTLLSLALADRINQERKGRFAATENANRLKSFLPQKVAELVVGGGEKGLLDPKRRQITVCVIDLRGFTPFSETSAPEDVMNVLREFFTTMGDIVEKHGGTVEHFAGDSMLIFFNAPLEIAEPEKQAIQTALEMRSSFESLRSKWSKQGHELGLGIGIADGYATIGAIGFLGRSQYAAIGAVTNLASRLCSGSQHGEILTTSRVLAEVGSLVESESVGEQTIKGFSRPIHVMRVLGLGQSAT